MTDRLELTAEGSNKKIHVLYLSRFASYEELSDESAKNDTLVMGFFDNVEEVFQKNGKGGETVDYLSAFGIHTASAAAEQKRTAKQLFTLIESEEPLLCHYCAGDSEPIFGAPHFDGPILPIHDNLPVEGEDVKAQGPYPAFVGIISITLNYFEDTDIRQIRDDLTAFIRTARSEKEIPDCAGEVSRNAEIRFFKCTNCSDLCISVSTIRLMDILLVSKAVQICTGQKAKSQFSPAWSFVTIPKKAFKEPENLAEQREAAKKTASITYFDHYIDTVVDANSYRSKTQANNKGSHSNKEAITVDFRVSFRDFSKEEEFVKLLYDAEEFETRVHSNSVDHIYRAAGVLGNGTYSVHLPFHEYLELFRFKYMNKSSLLIDQNRLESEQKLLAFLLKEITGREKLEETVQTRPRTVEISYQRIRFCYPKHIFETGEQEPTRFKLAWELRKKLTPEGIEVEQVSETGAVLPYSALVQKKDHMEEQIRFMLQMIATYRNQITSNEYRYREAVYMLNDLIYTYNDIFARGNVHTMIFTTQILALLGNVRIGWDAYVLSGEERRKKHLINEITENLRFATLALNRYSHEVVMNAGNNFNAQNYEVQSKVNIEKYVVAYSCFLQEICDAYRNEFPGTAEYPAEKMYPFVYLDIEQKRIQLYTLFPRFAEGRKKNSVPLMLAVAIPNYRRFANIYRMLPQMTHEISHRFVYYDDCLKENSYLLQLGAEDLGRLLAEEFCTSTEEWEEIDEIRIRLGDLFAAALKRHSEKYIDQEQLKTTSKKMLRDEILQPYAEQYCKIYSAYHNILPNYYAPAREEIISWQQMEEAIEELAEALHLPSEGVTAEAAWGDDGIPLYSELFLQELRTLMSAAENSDVQKASQAVKSLADLSADSMRSILQESEDAETSEEAAREARDEVLRGIVIETRINSKGEKACSSVIFQHQIFSNLITQILAGGMDHIMEINPNLDALYDTMMDTFGMVISNFYQAGTKDEMERALRELRILSKDDAALLPEMDRLEQQYRCYCKILNLILNHKQIKLTVSDRDSINNILKGEVQKLLEEYAEQWRNLKPEVITILNQFSDIEESNEKIDRMLGYLGTTGLVEAWYAYANVHWEVCADLSMCAAFGFDAFGYLVYMANLYIEHIENETLRIDVISREQTESHDFRHSRFLEVVQTLAEGTDPKLLYKTSEMLHILQKQLFYKLIPKIEGYMATMNLPDVLSDIIQKMKLLCSDCDRKNLKLDEIVQEGNSLAAQLNQLGLTLRKCIMESQQKGWQEEIRQQINLLSDYLRYARVVLQVCDFLAESGILTDSRQLKADEFYRKLYRDKIISAKWTRQEPGADPADYRCLSKRIGAFYNQCYLRFNSDYSFEEQVDFILHYYRKAHENYRELHEFWEQEDCETKEQKQKAREIWNIADEWLDCFFGEKEKTPCN